MDVLNLKGTDDTPTIVLNAEEKVFNISGRSLPEDAASFYNPVLTWLDDFATTQSGVAMKFEVKLEYFNTASSKLLLDIFSKLESINSNNGNSVNLEWYYEDDDEDMMEAGEEYSELVELNFTLKQY
ncbi:MAG: nuclear pore complex subunit [Bacteroidetes bacterium GWE2_29_8]|nr:MAG: nuclear pore complex subunit [Bacteroidetes bacterium GWE2_29_8]OFY20098.1 MAG: nuclear pore complex subunit [Bacteroidetes bacterium GWF2_29_10]